MYIKILILFHVFKIRQNKYINIERACLKYEIINAIAILNVGNILIEMRG
jgi:hypothetical protein